MDWLEIGPGPEKLGPGWTTLDCKAGPQVDRVAVWGAERLPFPDDKFALVYAAHVLEHLPWFQTQAALQEVFRILQPGGGFEVFVPDFEWLVDRYLDQDCGDAWRHANPDNDPMVWLNGRLFTYGGPGGAQDPNWHRSVFDQPYLTRCLERAGFIQLELLKEERGHRHGRLSLGMKGRKPCLQPTSPTPS